jgi:zinc protease
MYPDAHPHHYSVIGKHEDLQNAKLQDVIDFYRTWYTPANATLVIAGDIDLAKTKELVEKWFGELTGAPKPERKTLSFPNMSKIREQIEEDLVRQRMITYAWHTPSSYSQDDALLDLCADILADTGTGRLYKKLVIEKRLATQVTAWQRSQEHSSLFMVQVLLNPEADLAEVEKILQAEVKTLTTQPPSAAELNRALKKWESSFIWGLESLMARAEKLQTYNHYWGKPDGLNQDLQRYLQAKPEQIQKVARSFLNDNRLELLTVPAPKS